MIVKPTVTELLKKAENRYELVIATSKRARQIASGDQPLTKVDETSPVTIAANEINEGKVRIIREDEENTKEDENSKSEDVNNETSEKDTENEEKEN